MAEHESLPYFADAAGYMVLQPKTIESVGGDHLLWVGEVVKSVNLNDAAILTTDYLKEHKYIR
jgi:hypothetical protein